MKKATKTTRRASKTMSKAIDDCQNRFLDNGGSASGKAWTAEDIDISAAFAALNDLDGLLAKSTSALTDGKLRNAMTVIIDLLRPWEDG